MLPVEVGSLVLAGAEAVDVSDEVGTAPEEEVSEAVGAALELLSPLLEPAGWTTPPAGALPVASPEEVP